MYQNYTYILSRSITLFLEKGIILIKIEWKWFQCQVYIKIFNDWCLNKVTFKTEISQSLCNQGTNKDFVLNTLNKFSTTSRYLLFICILPPVRLMMCVHQNFNICFHSRIWKTFVIWSGWRFYCFNVYTL